MRHLSPSQIISFAVFLLISITSCGGGGSNNSETPSEGTDSSSSSSSSSGADDTSEMETTNSATGSITWTNSTFGVSGSIGITVGAVGSTLTSLGFSSDFDGTSDTISGLSAPFSSTEASSVSLVSSVYGPIDITFDPSSGIFSATRQDSSRGTINYEGTFTVSGDTLMINGTFSVPTFMASGPFSGSISGPAIGLLFGS